MKLHKTDYDESYFNTVADFNPFLNRETKEKIQLIKSLKRDGDLLEIGCGTGYLLDKLKDQYKVKGVDISDHAIKIASEKIDIKNLKVFNIEKEDLNKKYDIILAFDVMEHLKNPKEVLKKLKKHLKKEGVLVFSVPNNYGIYGKIMTRLFNYFDKTHISTYHRKKWINILKDLDFNIDTVEQSWFGINKKKGAKHVSFIVHFIAKV